LPGTTPKHLVARLAALRKRIGGWKVDALLVTCSRDVRYLSGFVGDDSWALVGARGRGLTLISDSRFQEQIAREAPHARVEMRRGPFADVLERLFRRGRIGRCAVQPASMTLATRSALARKLGARTFVPVADGLLDQRAVKDAREVAAICRAIRCQQEAFQMLLGELAAGDSELQLAGTLEMHMRRLGAEGASFSTIVAAGANASLPHAVPGRTKVKRGGIVLFDFGARVDGYCSDLTRVVALGRMPRRMGEVYRVVLDAQLAAIGAIGPGVPLKQVDAVARRIIEKAGYGDRFGHGLGHGIGLDIHEQPGLSPRSKGRLEAGQVVTVEPGIYLPGIGGIRIEDDVLVTPRGHRVLSDLPKDLASAII